MSGPILLTGATGFVGSHAAEVLRGAGAALRCTVRASSDRRWLRGLSVEVVGADLRDPDALEDALEGVESVVHVAGITRAPEPEAYRRVNVDGTERLARAAARRGIDRFVFVSSLAARGPDGAGGPVSAYGRSKREAEERLADGAGGELPSEIVVLRPGGVYGPRDTDLLPLFRMARKGWLPVPTGARKLQPVYATDVASAVRAAATADPSPGFGPWPLVERESHPWSSVAAALEEALERPVRTFPVPSAALVAAGLFAETAGRLFGTTPRLDRRRARDLARHGWTADPAPSEEALGWRPVVGLAEGLRRTADWYRERGWL